jgi:hypothetical protein
MMGADWGRLGMEKAAGRIASFGDSSGLMERCAIRIVSYSIFDRGFEGDIGGKLLKFER